MLLLSRGFPRARAPARTGLACILAGPALHWAVGKDAMARLLGLKSETPGFATQ